MDRRSFSAKSFVLAALVLAGAALLAADGSPAPAQVSVRIEPERAVIENSFLSVEVATVSKKVRTSSILNRITGSSTTFEGDDFVLVFTDGRTLKGSGLSLQNALEQTADGGGKRLTLELAGGDPTAQEIRDADLRLRVRIELRPGDWWATRWIEIEGKQGRLEKISLSEWRALGTYGPPGPGKTTEGLGYPQGYGQAAYVDDLFFAIEHPGAENFSRGKRIACRIAACEELAAQRTITTARFVVGVGEAGGAPKAFLRFIGERRANPPRMVFAAGGWNQKGAAPAAALEALAKAAAAVPVDSFILPEGWDLRDGSAPLWTAVDPARFPGGWEPLRSAARAAGFGFSLSFDPTGGPEARITIGRKGGFEGDAGRLCLAGPSYRKHVIAAFAAWAREGVDRIEVDGFRPDCGVEGHGHPVGPGAAVPQMDALIEVFKAWRKSRPGILIAHVAGSNPSPFWLEHADFVGPGGTDSGLPDDGEPFDRHATSIDRRLQIHRPTEMPISAFAVEDMTASLLAGTSDAAFERNAWWLVARTSLRHAWSVQAEDITPERWKVLERAARWGKTHERLFRLSRMIGGDPSRGAIYGFSAYEAGAGVLALRNPSSKAASLERSLSSLLVLSRAEQKKNYRLAGIHGETKAIEGVHAGRSTVKVELPPFAVAIFEVKEE